MSPNARDRARAKRRYVKRQAKLAQKQQARRIRQQVGGASLGDRPGGVRRVRAGQVERLEQQEDAVRGEHAQRLDVGDAHHLAHRRGLPQGDGQDGRQAAAVHQPRRRRRLAAGRTWTATVATTCGDDDVPAGRQEGAADGRRRSSSWPARASSTTRPATGSRHRGSTSCSAATRPAPATVAPATATGSRTRRPPVTTPPARSPWPATSDPKSNGSQFFLVYQDSKLPDRRRRLLHLRHHHQGPGRGEERRDRRSIGRRRRAEHPDQHHLGEREVGGGHDEQRLRPGRRGRHGLRADRRRRTRRRVLPRSDRGRGAGLLRPQVRRHQRPDQPVRPAPQRHRDVDQGHRRRHQAAPRGRPPSRTPSATWPPSPRGWTPSPPGPPRSGPRPPPPRRPCGPST